MPIFRVSVSSPDRQAMLDLVRRHRAVISDHGIRHDQKLGYTVQAFCDAQQVRELRQLGYNVIRHQDVEKEGRERMKEVGVGDRYAKRLAAMRKRG